MTSGPYPEQLDHRTADIQLMRTPDGWPRWPMLPLKQVTEKFGEFPRWGVLVAAEGHLLTVFKVDIFAKQTIETMLEHPIATYESYEAMYDAGWRVD